MEQEAAAAQSAAERLSTALAEERAARAAAEKRADDSAAAAAETQQRLRAEADARRAAERQARDERARRLAAEERALGEHALRMTAERDARAAAAARDAAEQRAGEACRRLLSLEASVPPPCTPPGETPKPQRGDSPPPRDAEADSPEQQQQQQQRGAVDRHASADGDGEDPLDRPPVDPQHASFSGDPEENFQRLLEHASGDVVCPAAAQVYRIFRGSGPGRDPAWTDSQALAWIRRWLDAAGTVAPACGAGQQRAKTARGPALRKDVT
jgi:colicin import membrane protein